MKTESKPSANGDYFTPKDVINLMEQILECEAPESIQAERKGIEQ